MYPYYRVRTNDAGRRVVSFNPPPGAGDDFILEYVSESWVAGNPRKTRIEGDNDQPLYDQDLMELSTLWRLQRRLGVDHLASMAEYETEMAMRLSDDSTADSVNVSGEGVMNQDYYGLNINEAGYTP